MLKSWKSKSVFMFPFAVVSVNVCSVEIGVSVYESCSPVLFKSERFCCYVPLNYILAGWVEHQGDIFICPFGSFKNLILLRIASFGKNLIF